jgi:RimJ/RimL family protein N-acetyltransferase
MTPLITTPNLRLRAPGIGDAKRFTDLLSNLEVSKNLSRVPHPFTMEHATQTLSQWRVDAHPSNARFVIEYGAEGTIGVIAFRDEGDSAHLGYWIGQPFWGRGLMTQAMKAVVQWYFSVTKAEMITSGVFHFNMASLAIQHKLGFVETGRSTLHCLALGQDVETIDTELTREAFEALKL